MKFVRGKGKKIDRRIAQADWDFPDHLNCVGMKKHAFSMTNFSDSFDWKQHASLVVRPHNRNQRGLRANRSFHLANIDIPISIHTQKCNVAAAFFEVLAGTQDRAVFHAAYDEMFSTRFELHRRMDHRVIGFCAAAGKNDFRRFASEQCR